MWGHKKTMPSPEHAAADRVKPIEISGVHFVNGTSMVPPFPEGMEVAYFGMGCFWGAEREFWNIPGVYTTAVGYAGGFTKNATYGDVCSGQTGHAEIVLVVYDPEYRGQISQKTQQMNVDYSAFEGWPIEGRPDAVTVRGRVQVRDGKFVGQPGHGTFLPRRPTHS